MGFGTRLTSRLRIGRCVVCRRLAWGIEHAYNLEPAQARLLLRLLGSAQTEEDISPVLLWGEWRWLVHSDCVSAHPEEMREVHRVRSTHRARPEGEQSEPGGTEVTVGMSQRDVRRLLGEPKSRTSLDDFLGAQLSVRTTGSGLLNEEYWFYDIPETPGHVLRVTFRRDTVVAVEELDWRG
jgi:hypothetical protein